MRLADRLYAMIPVAFSSTLQIFDRLQALQKIVVVVNVVLRLDFSVFGFLLSIKRVLTLF